MARLLIAFVLLIVLGYGALEAVPLLSGPSIRLTSPTPGATSTPLGSVEVSGRATHTETLTLDGGSLLIDESGRFSRELTLPRGGAILTLTATDRFGRSRTALASVLVP